MRRKRGDENPSHERWLVSYADFITLMFAFFVIMYAISRADLQRFKAVSRSMKKAFGADFETGANGSAGGRSFAPFEVEVPKGGAVPEAPAEQKGAGSGGTFDNPELRRLNDLLAEGLSYELSADDAAEKLQLLSDSRGLVIRLEAKGFYDPGQAAVRADAIPVLEKIGKVLATARGRVRVEGHTDSGASTGAQYPSNWELSSARAAWIVRYLIQNDHLDASNLEAVGLAEFHPIAPNDTPEDRARNRRVEILVTGK